MPKQSNQRIFLFGNEVAHKAGSSFEKDRKEIVDKMRKELPIGRKVKIELTTHRHPLEGKLVLLDDPLSIGEKNSNPTFEISAVRFKKDEILSWTTIE